jgi:hypothetical protein
MPDEPTALMRAVEWEVASSICADNGDYIRATEYRNLAQALRETAQLEQQRQHQGKQGPEG